MIKTSFKYKLNPQLVVGKTQEGASRAVAKVAHLVEREAKKLVNIGGGRGKKGAPNNYYHSLLQRWVKGSAPGQPPHKQTAALQSSIRVEMVGVLTALVGPSVRYGRWLEFGTKRMAARPFMRPALAKTVGQFPQFFKGII